MKPQGLKNDKYPPVEDYGLTGDLGTTALVGDADSSDCLCWPEFDFPLHLGRPCRPQKRRAFPDCPELDDMRGNEIYMPDTNILLSRFPANGGIAEVSDFMLCDGTFTLCSFWLIECTARKGDLKLARFLFEKILSYGNELGLFSEQLDQDGRRLGNIPQAFTHLALISAAYDLDRRLDGKITV